MRYYAGIVVVIALMFGFNGYTGYAPTAESKLGFSIKGKMSETGAQIPVLVIMKEQADLSPVSQLKTVPEKRRFVYDALRGVALKTQGDLLSWLQQKGRQYRAFYISNMVAVYGATPSEISQIAARPDVARITGNPTVQLSLPLVQSEALRMNSTSAVGDNITRTGAPRVWDEFKARGQGIVIAGQDTGVQWDHPALMKHYRGYSETGVSHDYNWHDAVHAGFGTTDNPCGYDLAAPCDDDKHGSHTMGTMVGDDGDANKIGMAPDAKWIACRNMDHGAGTPASYIECFEFFLAPYPHGANAMTDGDTTKAPDVINNSWGCPRDEGCEGDEMLPVVKAMSAAGIMVVASAGNDGSECFTIQAPPAHFSGEVLSVGAIDHRTDAIARFSSRGPSVFDRAIGPDISAPGVSIRSSVPGSGYDQAFWSGTSMAGPHVAGAVALIWSAKPQLRGQIRPTIDLLHRTADPKTSTQSCGGVAGTAIPNNTFGYGILNVYQAIK